MSLINEALKKAQKERTGESPSLSAVPTIGGERPDQISRRGKSTGMGELILPLGLGAAVVAMLVVGAVFLFMRQSEPPAPSAPPSVASSTAATPAPVSPSVQPAAPVQTAPQPVATTPPPQVVVAAPPQPEPATVSSFTVPNVTTTSPVAAQPEPVRPAAPVVTLTAPAPVVAAVTPPSTPAPQPAQSAGPRKLEPRAINYIEALRVSGIRVSAEPRESKVLMNDRVYRLGSLVEAEMGLRLVGITAASLTFEDDRGARYTRLFN
ncbi:MAG: hypothetical protein QG602_779 [Verrucomicrobiota bacterium]|nr:hypothetical protein [Verrucomicrobiota bacterium]